MSDRAPSSTVSILADWLRKVSGGLGDGNGGLQLHMRANGAKRTERVKEYVIRPESNLDHLAAEITADAHQEASGTGNGTHAFIAYAYRDGEGDAHFQSRRFLISIDSAPETGDADVDGGTLLSQAYRHMEANAKVMLQERQSMWGAMAAMMETVVSRLNHHEQSEASRMEGMLKATQAHAAAINVVEDHKLDREIKKNAADMAFAVAPMLAKGLAEKFKLIPKDEEESPADDPPKAPMIPAALETTAPVTFDALPVVIEAHASNGHTKPKRKSKRT